MHSQPGLHHQERRRYAWSESPPQDRWWQGHQTDPVDDLRYSQRLQNYYEDKNGNKNYLPGFIHANALALLTVGQEISGLDTETKVVNAYSAAAKAEVPTKVDMAMDLLGKRSPGRSDQADG